MQPSCHQVAWEPAECRPQEAATAHIRSIAASVSKPLASAAATAAARAQW